MNARTANLKRMTQRTLKAYWIITSNTISECVFMWAVVKKI